MSYPQKVYLVMASTGEYSDRQERPVTAFTDENRAKDFVLMCGEERDVLTNIVRDYVDDWEYEMYVLQGEDWMVNDEEKADLDRMPRPHYDEGLERLETRYFYYEADLDSPKVEMAWVDPDELHGEG